MPAALRATVAVGRSGRQGGSEHSEREIRPLGWVGGPIPLVEGTSSIAGGTYLYKKIGGKRYKAREDLTWRGEGNSVTIWLGEGKASRRRFICGRGNIFLGHSFGLFYLRCDIVGKREYFVVRRAVGYTLTCQKKGDYQWWGDILFTHSQCSLHRLSG